MRIAVSSAYAGGQSGPQRSDLLGFSQSRYSSRVPPVSGTPTYQQRLARRHKDGTDLERAMDRYAAWLAEEARKVISPDDLAE